MPKLTKGQTEGIRMIADLFVYQDMTKEVMSKMLTAEQLAEFKRHMQTKMPVIHEAGEELKRQVLQVRSEYRDLLAKESAW